MFATCFDREPLEVADHYPAVQAHVAGLTDDDRKRPRIDACPSTRYVLRLSSSANTAASRAASSRRRPSMSREFSQGGRTDPDDGNPACKRHNLFRHNHRYAVMRDRLGEWHTYRPDGTEVQ